MKTSLKLILIALIVFSASSNTIAHNSLKPKKLYVSQFGAIPNDGNDDSPGIAKAMEYARQNHIETVYFESGTYDIKEPVDISTGIEGEGKVILRQGDNANSYMFNINGDNVHIYNLNFDGNRANQGTPAFTENYTGFNKNSLLQSFRLFKNLHIKDCTFYNCQMGSIAFLSVSLAEVAACYPSKKLTTDGGPGSLVRVPESLTIESCNFNNQGTQAVSVFFDYSFATIQNDSLKFPGVVKLLNCNFSHIGTFTPNQPVLNRFRQGDTFICGGVNTLLVKNCNFSDSQRFDVKLGALNNVTVTDCSSHNPRWGFFQSQTAKISKSVGPHPIGNINIYNNHFLFDLPVDSIAKTENNIGIFVQLKGSIAKVTGHDYYDRVAIYHNFVAYKGANPKTWDCIQLTDYSKYRIITISDNYVQNNRRAFVSYIKPVIDNWQMDSLIIKNNVALNDAALVTDNSFFYGQGVSDNRINALVLQNNIALGYNISVVSEAADISNHLVIKNNKFTSQSGHAIWFNNKNNKIRDAQIGDNFLSGDMEDAGANTGLSNPKAITFSNNTFKNASHIKSSITNFAHNRDQVSDFKISLSELQNYKIISDNMNNPILSDEINKFVAKGLINSN